MGERAERGSDRVDEEGKLEAKAKPLEATRLNVHRAGADRAGRGFRLAVAQDLCGAPGGQSLAQRVDPDDPAHAGPVGSKGHGEASMSTAREEIVVGSGPNGLAAAITLAQAGRKVRVLEGKDKIGGGLRSADNLTLPGFLHDPCSAIHPLGIGSPFFRKLPLKELGLRWVFPPVAAAHPLDDGTAVLIGGRVETTALQFGRDARAYRMLMGPIVEQWQNILNEFLRPLRLPRHPLMMARFGAFALMPATLLARLLFREEPRPRRVRRDGCPCNHAAGTARDFCVRDNACDGGARHRLADGAGWVGTNRGRVGVAALQAGRTDRNRPRTSRASRSFHRIKRCCSM